MQYPVPPVVDSADPLAEQPEWRLATIRPDDPRFKHLPLVKGTPDGAIEVVRGDASWAERLANNPDAPKLFEKVGKTFFVVENRLGAVWLISTGARTPVGLIELRGYSHPVGLKRSVGAAESMTELIAALESEAERLRALAADGWELFRYPATGVQIWSTRVDRMRTSLRPTFPDQARPWVTSCVPRPMIRAGGRSHVSRRARAVP